MEDIDDRLLKIISLAKDGIGGERENAIRLVKKMCAEQGLNFDDVMNSVQVKEYFLHAADKNEAIVLQHVIAKFAMTREHLGLGYSQNRLYVYFECTPARFIETSNAWAIYQHAYRKEKARLLADLPAAFYMKHDLYLPPSEYDADAHDEKVKNLSQEERDKIKRQYAMTDMLDDVSVHKAIGSGK